MPEVLFDPADMTTALDAIMDGVVDDDSIAHFLTELARRGETVEELAAAAKTLRSRAIIINAPPGIADCCGTGGDGLGTYNVSTAVAFVAAACGLPVAKHGNRSASSRSGAADVLEALDVNLDVPPERLSEALHTLNFAFLMAPRHHTSLARVAAVRRKLSFRTIFNLLGPLINPAGATFQLVGVYDRKWLRPMAETLSKLGSGAAWVVHSHDGLDEISVSAPTDIAILKNGAITEKTVTPNDFGLHLSPFHSMQGGDARANAKALIDVLGGMPSAYRDCVIANSAALLHLSGRCTDLKQAALISANALDDGAALNILNRYKSFVSEP